MLKDVPKDWLGQEEPDYGGLGPALGSGDVLEDGWFDRGIFLEGEGSLWVFVTEIDPPRRDYGGLKSVGGVGFCCGIRQVAQRVVAMVRDPIHLQLNSSTLDA